MSPREVEPTTVEIEPIQEDEEVYTLDDALRALVGSGRPTARPYGYRIESACNAAMSDVITLYGAELGSESEAIRDLVARGSVDLRRERAKRG